MTGPQRELGGLWSHLRRRVESNRIVFELAKMALEPVGKVLEQAESTLQLAGRGSQPSGRPFEAS